MCRPRVPDHLECALDVALEQVRGCGAISYPIGLCASGVCGAPPPRPGNPVLTHESREVHHLVLRAAQLQLQLLCAGTRSANHRVARQQQLSREGALVDRMQFRIGRLAFAKVASPYVTLPPSFALCVPRDVGEAAGAALRVFLAQSTGAGEAWRGRAAACAYLGLRGVC